jgi:hypothetical protein
MNKKNFLTIKCFSSSLSIEISDRGSDMKIKRSRKKKEIKCEEQRNLNLKSNRMQHSIKTIKKVLRIKNKSNQQLTRTQGIEHKLQATSNPYHPHQAL